MSWQPESIVRVTHDVRILITRCFARPPSVAFNFSVPYWTLGSSGSSVMAFLRTISLFVVLIGFVACIALANEQAAETIPADRPPPLIQPSPPPTFDRSVALSVSQQAIGRQLGDYFLYDTNGERVKLSGYIGKPLVISMIYTSCHICADATRNLAKVVQKARNALGEGSFRVAMVGFDPANDTIHAMRSYARQQNVNVNGWDFLTGDKATIRLLADDLGFQFYPTPSGFDHLVQNSIVDKTGTVFRQVYGIHFDTQHLIEPLEVLVFDKDPNQSFLTQLTTRVKLFCTVYDTASDSYVFNYSILIALALGLTMGLALLVVVRREWVHSKRHPRHTDAPTDGGS